MAKYELTALQYQALTSSNCPTPSRKLSIAQTNISWFDAVNLADKYNQWLRSNALDKLPKEESNPDFCVCPQKSNGNLRHVAA